MNIFDNRVLTADEQDLLRKTVEDGVHYAEAIRAEQDSLKDMVKDAVAKLNDQIDDPDQKIKGSTVNKMIRVLHLRDIQEAKDKISEVEDGLTVIGKQV